MECDGNYYYVEHDALVNGKQRIEGKWYYFDNFIMQTGTVTINGMDYIFNEDGTMQIEWIGNKFVYDETGEYFKSCFAQIDDVDYYFDENGEYVTGFQEINGKTYVFDSEGKLIHDGFVEMNGNYYYVENDTLVNGKQRIEGKWYYFDNFIMQTGTVTINGMDYIFNEDGTMQVEWIGNKFVNDATGDYFKSCFAQIDGVDYYFDGNGEYVTGIQEIDGKTYVFDSEGKLIHDGFVEKDGNYYYVENDTLVNGKKKIDGSWYYFKDYIMQTGLQNIDGTDYLFNEQGKMVNNGFCKVKENTYYVEDDKPVDGKKRIDSKWYYFKDYIMQTVTIALY